MELKGKEERRRGGRGKISERSRENSERKGGDNETHNLLVKSLGSRDHREDYVRERIEGRGISFRFLANSSSS